MPIEHKDAQDPDIHEPKGISTATTGHSYIADGSGSGSWTDVSSIYGEMIITGNTSATALTAASDGTLETDSDYIKATSNWQAGALNQITFNVDELVVPKAGAYHISLWASYEIASTNALLGVKYAINDTAPFSLRKLLVQSKTTSDINMISGAGLIQNLAQGDTISIYVACDTTTNVTAREAGLIVVFLG